MPDKCLVKPPKPILTPKKLDIIFRRRNLPNTQYYFTNRKHTLPKAGDSSEAAVRFYKVPKAQNLLSFIRYSDRIEKLSSKKRLSQPLHLKDNLRIAATRDISRRLYIPEEPDGVKTVLEIHPEFYTVIEGRPVRGHHDRNVYIFNIRQCASLRQQLGYRRDAILNINRVMIAEKKECQEISDNLKQHIDNFQKFLTEDYVLACEAVEASERAFKRLEAQVSEYIGVVMEYITVTNLIGNVNALRKTLKIYRQFLLKVAPTYWREVFDETYTGANMPGACQMSQKSDTSNVLLESLSVEKVVADSIDELRNPPPNYLYHTSAQVLMSWYRNMELQSRDHLTQLSMTRDPYKLLLRRIQDLKNTTAKEMSLYKYYIDMITLATDRELYNEIYFKEKFMKILNETFFDSVASTDTLKLKICIEYVYERVLGKSEYGFESVRAPMQLLEVLYEDYSLKMDQLDFATVRQATKECFDEDLEKMNAAYFAQRELKEFNVMSAAINKAFWPPLKFRRPERQPWKSKDEIRAEKREERKKAALARGERIKRRPFKVSPEDYDDLVFFTDWCDGENPAKYMPDLENYVRAALQKPSTIIDQSSSSGGS